MELYGETILYDYKNVIEHCIQCIFKSGILLNEHYELLSQFWRSPNFVKAKHFKTHIASATMITGLITSIYRRSIIWGTISTIPLSIQLGHKLLMKCKCRSYKQQFSLFIDILQKIYMLNKKVMQHYQMQNVTVNNLGENTKKLIGNVILTKMLHFLAGVAENMLELILFLRNAFKQIGNIINIGELNFIFNIDINEENFKCSNEDKEEILNNCDKIHMGYVYIMSTFLCGFGLSLCTNEWKSENKDVLKLYSSILPDCLKYLQDVYNKIQGKFDIVSNRLYEDISENVHRNISNPTINIVNNLKEYIQISFDIVTSMQIQITSHNDNILMRTYLDDLESLFRQCNDNVRVLQYQIYKIPNTKLESPRMIENVNSTEDIGVITIKFNDPEENLEEEEFNLSIHDSDASDDEETSNLEYEQLLEYVRAQKLMIRELNDELRKRNVIKQIDVVPIASKRSFNKYKMIQDKPLELISDNETLINMVVPAPPPLPPHMPKAVLSSPPIKDSSVEPLESKYDFLEQIRAAASNRGVEETVFGDDIFCSEDSSDD